LVANGTWRSEPYATSGTAIDPRLTEGTLWRRLFAYLIDLVVIAVLMGILWVFIALLGVITLGFGWVLFALLPFTAIIYNAVTIGGPYQSTAGMRMTGLRVIDAATLGPVPVLTAAVHALLFYVAAGTLALLALDIVIGMIRDDHRLGHDLLTGVMVIRGSS
jgi:uncharacterized RDD family membrane protein YckC